MDNFDVDMQEMIGLPDYVQMPKQLDGIEFDVFDIHFESQVQNKQQPDVNRRDVKNVKELKDMLAFMRGRDKYTTLDQTKRNGKPVQANQKPKERFKLSEDDLFRAIDETTAESSENQFVTRLMKVPVGKKLPQLDEKILSHFWTEAHNKPFFDLQESEENQEFMQADEEEPEQEIV